MTTAQSKLRTAHANGPSRVETRDGREFRVFVLVEATPDDMPHRPTGFDLAAARRGLDARGLMKAPVEGSGPATDEGDALDSIRNPFMHVISPGGADGGGLVAHRGVLHSDEYVSTFELQRLVEAELGFTYAQIRAVYRQGPLSKEQRQLREQIDARLLALRRSGGNLTELGRAIGFEVNASGHVRPFDNAIGRARAIEQWKAALES